DEITVVVSQQGKGRSKPHRDGPETIDCDRRVALPRGIGPVEAHVFSDVDLVHCLRRPCRGELGRQRQQSRNYDQMPHGFLACSFSRSAVVIVWAGRTTEYMTDCGSVECSGVPRTMWPYSCKTVIVSENSAQLQFEFIVITRDPSISDLAMVWLLPGMDSH